MSREKSSRQGRLFVGTSGWVYPDWVGTVYPERMKSGDTFAYYARHFNTVELNSTFYHFPRESTIQKWKALAGKDFTWAVKGWRWISHVKRLKGVGSDLKDFLGRVAPIVRGGVTLFQLPPSFKQDLKRLEAFLKQIPRGFRVAMEFRNNSWFVEPTYELLRRYSTALVGVDAPGIDRVLEVRTAPFAYFRFHGSSQWYRHDYSQPELAEFARHARRHWRAGDLYVYFDNTADGHAFRNALEFRDMLPGSARRG